MGRGSLVSSGAKGSGSGVGEEEGVGVPEISGLTDMQPTAQTAQKSRQMQRTNGKLRYFIRNAPPNIVPSDAF